MSSHLCQRAASAERMRTHERMPFSKERNSYFSFGEWMRSSDSAKPTSRDYMPSIFWKSPTIGTEPPMPMTTAGFGHSSDSALFALPSSAES